MASFASPSPRPGSGSGGSSDLVVAGCGTGGIAEIAANVNPENVTWGIAKVPVGSGTFKREKMVFLYFNLDSCPAIKRARLAAKKGEIKKAMGEVAAEMSFSDLSEVTLDAVLGELGSLFRVDSGEEGVGSVAKLKEEYEAMLAKIAKAKAEAARPSTVALTRPTAVELSETVKGADVLKSLRERMGPFNWALFRPTADSNLDFVNGGSLSVPELQKWLKDDELLCGVVRLAFGAGRFRRVKWAFLTWSGRSAGAVKRAKAMGARTAMKAKLGPVSVDLEESDRAAVTLAAVIDKVKRAAVVDGEEVETDGVTEDSYSLENFMAALTEEASANAAFFGDSGLVMESAPESAEDLPWSQRPAGAVITEMRRPGTPLNWAIFTLGQP